MFYSVQRKFPFRPARVAAPLAVLLTAGCLQEETTSSSSVDPGRFSVSSGSTGSTNSTPPRRLPSGPTEITSISTQIVDYSLSNGIAFKSSIGTVGYGYDIVNGRLAMLAEDAISINSSSNVATGRGYYSGTYRGVVATPEGTSVIRESIGGTIRMNADFNNNTISGSDGKLSVSGTVSPTLQFFSGSTTYVTEDSVLTGRASGTAGRLGLSLGFVGTDGDSGFAGGLTTGPLIAN